MNTLFIMRSGKVAKEPVVWLVVLVRGGRVFVGLGSWGVGGGNISLKGRCCEGEKKRKNVGGCCVWRGLGSLVAGYFLKGRWVGGCL